MRSLVRLTISDLELHTSNSALEFTVLVANQTHLSKTQERSFFSGAKEVHKVF